MHGKQVTAMMRVIVGFLAAVWVVGCGPSKAVLKKQVSELESEIVRIRSERVNLDAHAKALDDRVFILKKRLDKCQNSESQKKPRLKVVRLTADTGEEPQEESGADAADSGDKARVEERIVRVDEKRPRLVLSGRPARSHAVSHEMSEMPGGRLTGSNAYERLGADDLGVAATPLPMKEGEDRAMAVFNSAYRAYSNREYAVAMEGFSGFVKAFPDHHYADNALYWRGECYLASGQMLRAIGEFERLASRYPKSDKVPSGLYRIGFVYDKLRDYKKAVEYYFKVVDRFPGTDAARRASRRVSEIEAKPGGKSGIVPTAVRR
jgi:tol-pal system protein YbgF